MRLSWTQEEWLRLSSQKIGSQVYLRKKAFSEAHAVIDTSVSCDEGSRGFIRELTETVQVSCLVGVPLKKILYVSWWDGRVCFFIFIFILPEYM